MLHRDSLRGVFACVLAAALAIVTPSALAQAVAQADAQADNQPPGRVGRIADVGGELFLAPQDAPDQWIAIGQNYPVTTGDNLWAEKDSRAEIDFGGGQFRLSGETSLYVSRLDERQFALFVAQGRVILRVRFLDAGDTARIDTPNAQIALTRPGLYRIDVTDDRLHTEITVREGAADVDTGTAVQQVLPGQHATLDGAAPLVAFLRNGVNTDGFDTWSATRDRHYERGYANAPVSRQMVGQADLDEFGTWDSTPEYGAVWYPANVAPDWAPYQTGYWTEVGAWGPTWVDAAPWGYAPFHYGRWAHIRGRWGWCPGRYVARPVWAPALVGWVGGPGWRVSIGTGGPVYGWVPLGWGESYHPRWRGCSDACWARYNAPYSVNVARRNDAPPARFVNVSAPGAVTAVPGSVFTGGKPVNAHRIAVPSSAVATAPVLSAPPARSGLHSVSGYMPGNGKPPPASTTYSSAPRQQRTATPATASPAQSVAVPVSRPASGLTSPVPPPAPPPVSARPQPSAPSPTVSANPQPTYHVAPVPATQPSGTPSAPPVRADSRLAQPIPSQPHVLTPASPPAVSRNVGTPLPNTGRELRTTTPAASQPPPMAAPQAMRPAPAAPGQQATHPAPAAPGQQATHPAPAAQAQQATPAATPAARPHEAAKADKQAPIVKAPDTKAQ